MHVAVGTVEVDGRTIAYRSAGDGPPLVLLHGGWSDSRAWRLQLEGLADEFRVVAWDAPGCGGSWDPPGDFSLADYADVLAGFVRVAGLARPAVVGLSFGGGLALALAERHPAVPGALVLASAYAGWAGSLPADVVAARVAKALDEARRPPEEWVGSYLPGFFAGPVDEALVDELTAIMCDARPAGVEAMVHAFAAADLRDGLGHLDVPTLLLYGERDERAPLAVARDLHARIPGAELAVVPGVGHLVNLEAPAAFDAEVRRFLHRSRPGS